MDLNSYLAILWRNKWVILATMIVTITVVTVGTFMATPIFSTTTTLRIATASGVSTSSADYMYADRLMNTYTKIATSRPVLDELAAKMGLDKAPQVKVQTLPSTELIQVSVESPNPVLARDAANALAEILINKSTELYSGGGKSTLDILGEQLALAEQDLNQSRQDYEAIVAKSSAFSDEAEAANVIVQMKERTFETIQEQYDQARLKSALRENIISVVDPAVLPLSPSKPRKTLNIGLGFMIGLAGGIGLAFLLENLSSRLNSSDQIQAVTELNVIGKVPAIRRRHLFTPDSPDSKYDFSAFKEAIRYIRTKIATQNKLNRSGQPFKTLMLTSAIPGEGKSTIINNLAVTFAQAGQDVVVVDCDMRRPVQHKLNNIPNRAGLSNILGQRLPLNEALQKTRFRNMQVITSGPLPPNPAELLGSLLMKPLLDQLALMYDIVLLDAPAMLPVVDSSVLAPIVDGVALVVRRNMVREEAVREACKQLELSNTNLIGLIVNDSELNGTYYYYHNR